MDSHGGWVMTSADMVRFADAVDGRSGVPALLSPATIQRMTTRDPKVEGTKYGLGWELNLPGWGHGGALTTGTHSQLEHRDDGVTWAVVYNSLPADPERGFQGLLDTAAISIDGVRAAVISCTQGR
jgi:CubicO group peptidase (beta-lactamase class C family)